MVLFEIQPSYAEKKFLKEVKLIVDMLRFYSYSDKEAQYKPTCGLM